MRRHAKKHIFIGLVATTSAVLLFGMNYSNAITDQMHDWKILPEPERLTELYFTNSVQLPVSYNPGISQVVAFTVHNLEYRPVTYHYVIDQVRADGGSSVVAMGSIPLNQDDHSAQNVSVTLQDLGPSRIRVRLDPTNISIQYKVNEG